MVVVTGMPATDPLVVVVEVAEIAAASGTRGKLDMARSRKQEESG